jgi:exonuclease III
MRLVTWNVNALKIRMPRVLELLAELRPDVLCMQETEAEDAAFPPVTSIAASACGSTSRSSARAPPGRSSRVGRPQLPQASKPSDHAPLVLELA